MIRALDTLSGLELMMLLEHTDVHYSVQTIDDFLNKPHYICLGEYIDDYLRGVLILCNMGDTMDVMQVVTHPDYRKRGIAHALFGAAEPIVGPHDIILEVNEKNETAIALYKSLGFEMISKRLNYYGRHRHALIMRKEYKHVITSN